MNLVTKEESRLFGGDKSLEQDGARPSATVATAEAQEDKKSEARIRFCAAFTIIEILIVIGIILFLAGLLLAVSGYVQEKGKRARAEAEIAAMSAALESYKADNGIYPRDNPGNQFTDNLNARSSTNPANYQNASLFLFTQLSGLDANQTPISGVKSYFGFKPLMLGGPRDANGNVTSVSYIRDPFGNSYGYSTAYQNNPNTGYNPTYDLWSTGGSTADTSKWIKNW